MVNKTDSNEAYGELDVGERSLSYVLTRQEHLLHRLIALESSLISINDQLSGSLPKNTDSPISTSDCLIDALLVTTACSFGKVVAIEGLVSQIADGLGNTFVAPFNK